MYRKNTAGQYISFQLVKTADGTAGTGLTPTLRVCKDGTWAAKNASTTITEDTGTGCYTVALAATDTNGNNISYAVSATGCVPVCINIVTTAADPTDSAAFGLTRIDAAVSSRLASASYAAPLDEAGTRTAVGLASANLDTQIGTLATAANLSTANTNISGIKAKTDSLTFTVAGQVDANVQYVNDVQLQGAGVAGNSMRPV